MYKEMSSQFSDYLSNMGLRKTEERYTILKAICSFHGHFDINRLAGELEKANYRVSKATLYNTLNVLVDAGLLVRHPMTVQSVQYELRIYADTHLHLICTECGSIRETRDAVFVDNIKNQRLSRFMPDYYCLYVYGLCGKCRAKSRRSSK